MRRQGWIVRLASPRLHQLFDKGASDGLKQTRPAACRLVGRVAGAVDAGDTRGRYRSDERDRNTCVRPNWTSYAAWVSKATDGSDAVTQFRFLCGGPNCALRSGLTNTVTVILNCKPNWV